MGIDIIGLKESSKEFGQDHIFRFWNELNEDAQASLAQQVELIDFAELDRLIKSIKDGASGGASQLDGLEPAPFVPHIDKGGDAQAWKSAYEEGEKALRAGRVAAFTVAGGQGTRLGYDGPKGTFPVTPIKKLPLFKVFADKLFYINNTYDCKVPWYLMVSEINREDTMAFFKENNYFDLDPSQVHFLTQGSMPAVDLDGKIILEEKGKIATSPDGHGGALRALVRSGAIDEMKQNGQDIISYFQVDNPLVQCIDPAFIGFHVKNSSELSSKTIPKASDKEKVGHFCVKNNEFIVIEYSDMPDELTEAKDDNGKRKFDSGSIAIHVFDREFVRKLGGSDSNVQLPFHLASKKIRFLNEKDESETPSEPNGTKFEMFIFDALPFAQNPVIIGTVREDDFSPVKNAEGIDSALSARDDQLRQYARWLNAAGVAVEVDESGLPNINIEISQRFANNQTSFVEQWNKMTNKPEIIDGTCI